ncbi:MAG: AAA family ATPase [Actinomycetales bacterium]|nr:AAA family ATPase [Actinomycetales bacterium]
MDPRTATEGRTLSTDGTPGTADGPASASTADDPAAAELAVEQAAVDLRYSYLDAGLRRAVTSLDRVRRGPTAGTPGALTERDAFDAMYSERIAALRAAEDRLVFGRMDLTGDASRYIGRIGLSDEHQEQVLYDWRSPAAEPFYRATASHRLGVTRRRHLTTSGREVTRIEDDVLDIDAHAGSDNVQGEGSLLAALGAHRTGRMRDIVATIQGEQDRIIRSPLQGVLVVQGAPGCGKTVVALHRAAYLLYTHRERIAQAGVLVVGPNRQFVRYIEQVLPSLGESSAVLVTQGQLYPGVDAEPDRDRRSAVLKGDLRMARMVGNAVASIPRVPDNRIPLVVDGTTITLTPRMVESAIAHAKRGRAPHNEARREFVLDVLGKLATQLAQKTKVDVHEYRDSLMEDLRDSVDVRRAVNLCWMPWTPERLVRRLFSDDRRLAKAAPWLTVEERAVLMRPADAPWETGDVPLLDEAAELLGVDDEPARLAALRAERESAKELAYARDVAALSGSGMVTADMLVERYAGQRARTSVADAENDRTWAFGHVVVDEAQELSPMAWRVVARRCPSMSMTVVGDVNQTGSPAGVTSWSSVFDVLAKDRWTIETLSVNYRTPRPVMELATAGLRAAGIDAAEVVSARDGDAPRSARIAALAALPDVLHEELHRAGAGRVAVIAAERTAPAVGAVLAAAMPALVGVGDTAVDNRIAVLSPTTAKGLEFDAVVIVNPADVAATEGSGPRDLYVATTRTTAHLLLLDVDDA